MRLDFSNSQQMTTFLLSIALGAALCLIYDIVRFLMSSFKYGGVAVFFSDVLFFVVAGIVTFVFFVLFSKGTVRFYVFLGEGIGFLFFRILFSKIVRGTLKFINQTICKLIELLTRPIFRLYKILVNLLRKSVRRSKRQMRKFLNLFKESLNKMRLSSSNFAKNFADNRDKQKKVQKNLKKLQKSLETMDNNVV